MIPNGLALPSKPPLEQTMTQHHRPSQTTGSPITGDAAQNAASFETKEENGKYELPPDDNDPEVMAQFYLEQEWAEQEEADMEAAFEQEIEDGEADGLFIKR